MTTYEKIVKNLKAAATGDGPRARAAQRALEAMATAPNKPASARRSAARALGRQVQDLTTRLDASERRASSRAEGAPTYEDLVAALRELAEGDDENAEKARKALEAMGESDDEDHPAFLDTRKKASASRARPTKSDPATKAQIDAAMGLRAEEPRIRRERNVVVFPVMTPEQVRAQRAEGKV